MAFSELLTLIATVQVVLSQLSGNECNFDELLRAHQRHDQCMKQFFDLKMLAIQEIKAADPMCYRGMEQAVSRCSGATEGFGRDNDLDVQGIMECCFEGQVRGSGQRRCEFKTKDPMQMKSNEAGKEGGPMEGRMGPGPGSMMGPGHMIQQMMSSVTLTDMVMKESHDHMESVEHLKACMGERRMINSQASDIYRRKKDQLISKLFDCTNIMVPAATNCTDAVQTQELMCMMNGKGWMKKFMEGCYQSCMPGSLDVFCRMITSQSGAGDAQNQNQFPEHLAPEPSQNQFNNMDLNTLGGLDNNYNRRK